MPPEAPAIQADALVKTYGGRRAVDGLSFAVPPNSVFGLLGPNGAGKTTTIRMLLGLVRPSAGTATVLGRKSGSHDYWRALRAVGSVIEEPALYRSVSGRRNLEIHARYLRMRRPARRIAEVLELVGLGDRARDKVKRYSQGMRQRLGLAVALLGRPEVVILDEPTNGLDPAGIVEMRALIRRLPDAGTTVLLSSHLLSEVEMVCDSVAIVDRGRLVAAGTTTDLIARHGLGAHFDVTVLPAEAHYAVDVLAGAGLRARAWDDGRVEVDAAGGLTGRHLSYLLAAAGVYPERLARRAPTLEDVFLALTGQPHPGIVPPQAQHVLR
jgi:ABC-2 type transport system ATP-binding protein